MDILQALFAKMGHLANRSRMIGDGHDGTNQQDLDRQHLDNANSARDLANSSSDHSQSDHSQSDHSQSDHSQSTSLAQAAKMLVRLAQNARFREVAVMYDVPRKLDR
jgi:protein required for attachment to host cells